MSEAITPFKIAIDQAQLDDLKRRLALRAGRTRKRRTTGRRACRSRTCRSCATTGKGYDWRARETRLNRFPQFTTTIDGLDIHFIHVRSPHANALPLVMTHGWPGSIVEFLKVIGRPGRSRRRTAAARRDAFHVVCPSLPGYGFSGKPTHPGWGVEKIADAWATLMARLGYDSYVRAGRRLGLGGHDRDRRARHRALQGHPREHADRPRGRIRSNNLTELEQRGLAGMKYYQDWDSGYSKQQSTRPQTLGYGLVDSPSGQAAWIIEKFWAWTDCDGHPENALTRDEMLDNVMLYWLTGSAASSARLYWESFGTFSAGEVQIADRLQHLPEGDLRLLAALGGATATRTSCTGTNSTRAATSRRSSNPERSSTRCAPASDTCAERRRPLDAVIDVP